MVSRCFFDGHSVREIRVPFTLSNVGVVTSQEFKGHGKTGSDPLF